MQNRLQGGAPKFPFDAEFQRKIVKLALEDDGFAVSALRHLTPEMFESDILRWAWTTIIRERKEGRVPTLLVIRDQIRKLDQVLQPRYQAMVNQMEADVIREDKYLRYQLSDFIQRNIIVSLILEGTQLYNVSDLDGCVDQAKKKIDRYQAVTFEASERKWFYDDLLDRQALRQLHATREWEHTFPTGITGVDEVLDGGLSRGELGAWVADAKGGKSLFLVHLAGYAARAQQRKVLFVLLEGNYAQTASRLDAWHANVLYREAKRGQFPSDVFLRMRSEYQALRRNLVICEMTKSWSYSAADIRAHLDELKAQSGWVPDMIVVDYGDLLRSQVRVGSEEEHQRNAFSDLKSLTSHDNGYAIWTASQARRPGERLSTKKKKDKDAPISDDCEGDEKIYKYGKPVIGPKDIADSYNKIRRVDFIGSINQDAEDKANKQARLYCALYRDNPADRVVTIKQNLDNMMFVDVLDPINRPDRPEAVLAKIEKQRRKAEAGKQVKKGVAA